MAFVRWCKHCSALGIQSPVCLFQINFTEAVQMCKRPECLDLVLDGLVILDSPLQLRGQSEVPKGATTSIEVSAALPTSVPPPVTDPWHEESIEDFLTCLDITAAVDGKPCDSEGPLLPSLSLKGPVAKNTEPAMEESVEGLGNALFEGLGGIAHAEVYHAPPLVGEKIPSTCIPSAQVVKGSSKLPLPAGCLPCETAPTNLSNPPTSVPDTVVALQEDAFVVPAGCEGEASDGGIKVLQVQMCKETAVQCSNVEKRSHVPCKNEVPVSVASASEPSPLVQEHEHGELGLQKNVEMVRDSLGLACFVDDGVILAKPETKLDSDKSPGGCHSSTVLNEPAADCFSDLNSNRAADSEDSVSSSLRIVNSICSLLGNVPRTVELNIPVSTHNAMLPAEQTAVSGLNAVARDIKGVEPVNHDALRAVGLLQVGDCERTSQEVGHAHSVKKPSIVQCELHVTGNSHTISKSSQGIAHKVTGSNLKDAVRDISNARRSNGMIKVAAVSQVGVHFSSRSTEAVAQHHTGAITAGTMRPMVASVAPQRSKPHTNMVSTATSAKPNVTARMANGSASKLPSAGKLHLASLCPSSSPCTVKWVTSTPMHTEGKKVDTSGPRVCVISEKSSPSPVVRAKPIAYSVLGKLANIQTVLKHPDTISLAAPPQLAFRKTEKPPQKSHKRATSPPKGPQLKKQPAKRNSRARTGNSAKVEGLPGSVPLYISSPAQSPQPSNSSESSGFYESTSTGSDQSSRVQQSINSSSYKVSPKTFISRIKDRLQHRSGNGSGFEGYHPVLARKPPYGDEAKSPIKGSKKRRKALKSSAIVDDVDTMVAQLANSKDLSRYDGVLTDLFGSCV